MQILIYAGIIIIVIVVMIHLFKANKSLHRYQHKYNLKDFIDMQNQFVMNLYQCSLGNLSIRRYLMLLIQFYRSSRYAMIHI